MKFSLAPLPALVVLITATVAIPVCAQTPPAQSPPIQSQPAQPPAQSAPQNPNSHVIFSRSTDENGETTTTVGSAAQNPSAATAPIATDAEREAVTITAFDLDVHLDPAHQHIAIRAQLTARNDGAAPLAHIPLQISSSLDWESIRIDTRNNGAHGVAFETATLNSDADHTGQLHEAAVPLAEPLAPGATLALDVTYSGAIAQSAQRLTALGAPQDVALHSDWDQVGIDFTGLRGFGNVVWYPVSSVPVILGDGARLFDEIGRLKLRGENTEFRLRLTCEFPRGQAPTVAVINGHPAPLTLIEPPPASGELSSFATATFAQPALGFNAPSLFVAIRTPAQAANATLWTLPEDAPAVSGWSAAATAVTPFLENWLGPHPRSTLTVLDLPEPADAPFETGSLLAAPVNIALTSAGNDNQDGARLDAHLDAHLRAVLIHALTHAWLSTSAQSGPVQSRPAWLDEGVAAFLGTLWIEKQQGRTRALESLEADRQALALAEPASPGEDPGQPLRQAYAPIYYRTKAAYVFWMLRDLAGDAALSAAIRDYKAAEDNAAGGAPGEFEKLIESNSGEIGSGENSSGLDLRWFFLDWVDADKGLPDIAITHVAIASVSASAPGSSPSAEDGSGNILVAVDLSNSGYASAEIPVTVRTTQTTVTQRVLVPARGNVTRRILVQGTPTQVQANDGSIPETQASVHITTLNNAGALSPGSPGPPQ